MNKRNAVIIVVSLVILTAMLIPVTSCSSENTKETPKTKETPGSQTQKQEGNIKSISSVEELNKLIESNSEKLMVFDLYADWCMPCKVLAPTFNTLANTHKKKANFYRINVDKSPDLAQAFGVRGIPYVVFVRNKQTVYAMTGLNPKESYEKVITSCGSAESPEACIKELEAL